MDLSIENLGCRRAGRQIFRNITFALPRGTAAVLRGPNGAGKTTLLRALAGLLPVAEGTARIGGLSLTADRSQFQERLAYVGHLDAVKPALSVFDNLAVWTALNGEPKQRATDALDRFGLSHISGRRAAECSAGQKRRLNLARLLIADRALWLLDEPTVSLDVDAKAFVADLVRGHVEAGGIALIATHEDLGLGSLPQLDLSPIDARGSRDEADPFLSGDWT
ncbi:MAG: heme ABC exporter ATP-binding protein CcmA [Pseudomonadota bacterium]